MQKVFNEKMNEAKEAVKLSFKRTIDDCLKIASSESYKLLPFRIYPDSFDRVVNEIFCQLRNFQEKKYIQSQISSVIEKIMSDLNNEVGALFNKIEQL